MKTANAIKRIFVIGLILLLFTLLAACQEDQPETMLQPPIEGLSWGMTQEEALEALGLEKDEIYLGSDSGNVWRLTPEQAGMDTLAGLAFYGKEPHVEVAFKNYAGTERLFHVSANVQAENGPVLKEALTAVYGEPYVGDWTLWSGTDLTKNAAKADMEKLDEYDLGTALQITGGERKLFAVRPFVSVQYYDYLDGSGPVLESESTKRFRVMYTADTYLLSLYGSEPLPEYKPTLDSPVSWVVMGMSRANFGQQIGYTEEEMETKYKDSILVSCEELGLTEDGLFGLEFFGFDIACNPDGDTQDILFYFDEHDGYLCCVQANVTADSEEALKIGLTELLGEPSEVDGELRWYGYDYNNPDAVHERELYASYFNKDALKNNVYTLCVYFDLGFEY